MKFWVPTRQWVLGGIWVAKLQELNSLPNVTVRPSALAFGEDVPEIPGLSMGTTADRKYYTCPKPDQGNQCRGCRICWDSPDLPVTYHAH